MGWAAVKFDGANSWVIVDKDSGKIIARLIHSEKDAHILAKALELDRKEKAILNHYRKIGRKITMEQE